MLKTSEVSDMLLRFFSNKFVDKLGQSQLIDQNQDYNFTAIKGFCEIEYKLFATIERFRNYHSHYIHEPGILTFEDLFKNNTVTTTSEFQDALRWFEEKYVSAKQHLISSLENKKKILLTRYESSKDDNINRDIESIDKTITKFNYLYFFQKDKKRISRNAQLFIASMFMYKRQINVILEKWRGFKTKDLEGYENSLHTFFTYYCMSESYSLNNFDDNLLKFREILSKLSTVPFIDNEQLSPIYSRIREKNEENYKKIEITSDYKKVDLDLDKNQDLLNSENPDEVRRAQREIRSLTETLSKKKRANSNIIESYLTRKLLLQTIQEQKKNLDEITDGKIRKLFQKQILEDSIKAEELDFSNQIIPIRKRNIFTEVLLDYLLDNNLIDDSLEIAIAKTSVDKDEYFLQNKKDGITPDESLESLKNRMKKVKGKPEYQMMLTHYKELKRNFSFRNADELRSLAKPKSYEIVDNEGNKVEFERTTGFKYADKVTNALIRYTLVSQDEREYKINIVVSPQLLMKWVFIHLTERNNEGWNTIKKFLDRYILRIANINDISVKRLILNYLGDKHIKISEAELTHDFIKKYDKQGHNLNKIFPRSIMQSAGLKDRVIDTSESLQNRIDRLEKFVRTNKIQAKPWKYESKKKMDTIIEYLHFKILEDVYHNNIHLKNTADAQDPETFIRHNYFSVSDYDKIRQYLRFFGRYKNRTLQETKDIVQPYLIEKIKEQYFLVFGYITEQIDKSYSLEDLFEAVIYKYINELQDIYDHPEAYGDEQIIKMLKIDEGSDSEHVNSILKIHYIKNLALSDEIISVQEICKAKLAEKIKSKTADLEKRKLNPANLTDYAFMRAYMEEQGIKTNTDFIMQHIIPKVHFENLEKGKKMPIVVWKKLLKLKTEELMMWKIAKSYWFKEYNKEYVPEGLTADSSISHYQVFNTFYKVYKEDLNITLPIEPKFWNETNRLKFKKVIANNPGIIEKSLEIKIKIPAKRYSNLYLGVETKLIREYCLWNHCKNNEIVLPAYYKPADAKGQKKIYNLTLFDDLMKVIQMEIKKSMLYVSDLLFAEKKLADRFHLAAPNLTKKYLAEELTTFYLTISNKKSDDYETALLSSFLQEIKDNNSREDIKDYLVLFRNYAMHYQLQDPIRSKLILKLLKDISKKYRITDDDSEKHEY